MRGRRLARVVGQGARPYVAVMCNRVNAAIETRLSHLLAACARRRWPALRVVPLLWIRPAVRPVAIRLRRVLAVATLSFGVAAGLLLLAVLAILT